MSFPDESFQWIKIKGNYERSIPRWASARPGCLLGAAKLVQYSWCLKNSDGSKQDVPEYHHAPNVGLVLTLFSMGQQ